mmetsp:Transcript_46229/g.130732  ORF Transcript_46229/g.130732 Transcript_46229/m.130732 type:complete len:510 (+) Transcript_46229:94-1623(+)
MASPGTAIFAALLALACPAARGQLYEFKDTPLPANKTLHVLQLFHVFSRKEGPDAGRSFESARLTFKGFESHSTLPSVKDADMADYQGVQVSVMPFPSDLSEIINPAQFCSTPADVQASLAQAVDQIIVLPSGRNVTHSHTVKFGPKSTEEAGADLQQGGVYMLVFSNCGEFANATVSGSVLVKNSYGFLPGSEYYKMPFFGWLAIVYAIMFAVWAGLLVMKYQELVFLHYYVLGLALVGLLETASWWMTLSTWNATGSKERYLSCAAVVLSVMKVSIAYMFILALAQGWGVTTQALERNTNKKMEALTFFYVVACYVRETTLSFRHSHNLPASYVVGSLLPTALLNALIFAWIFSSLGSLIGTLSERYQEEATGLFKSSRAVLGGCVVVVYSAFVVQVLEIFEIFSVSWRYSWVLSDAVCHAVFVAALGIFMLLWKPDRSLQMYSYSPEVPTEESMEDGNHIIGAPDQGVLPDDDDLDTLGLTQGNGGPPKGGVSPDVIGLTGDKAVE